MRPLLIALAVSACGRVGFSEADSDARPATSDAGGDVGDGATLDAVLPGNWSLAASQPSPSADLWAAYAFSASDRWVAGTLGTIQHFDGSTWSPVANPATDTLFVFWGTAPDDVWLVGRGCTALRWMGTSWMAESVPGCAPGAAFFSIDGSATTNIWLTGTAGTIVQWNGAWQDHSQGNDDFWDVWVTSVNDVYAVGAKGTIVHWNGSMFVAEPGAPNLTLAAIWGTGTGEYWIVGSAGTILHKVGAGSWTAVPSPTTQFLYAVYGTSATDVWAVGSGGVILHYDGTSWTLATSPTALTLRNLAAVPGVGLMAVGDTGVVLAHP